jgi:hypothetical protein
MLTDLTTFTRDKLRPMTETEGRMFIGLVLGGIPDEPQPLSYFDDMGNLPFVLAVLVQRLKATGLSYSPRAIMFAAMQCDTPGLSVMWAYTLFCGSRDGNPWTLDRLTGEADSPFALGVPTNEALHAAWDAQKDKDAPLGNLLDADETWQVHADA